MNVGEQPTISQNGLLTTVAATLGGEKPQYALEGSVFIGGAVIQWLRDEMRFFSDSRDAEYYARKVPDTGGVYIVPAFTGIGAPYWDMYARGTIKTVNSDNGTVVLNADYRISKNIPLDAVVIGIENQSAYKAVPSEKAISVSGPRGVVERISVAMIEVGGALSDGKVQEEFTVKFYDAMQNEIDMKGALTYTSEGIFVTIEKINQEDIEEQNDEQ